MAVRRNYRINLRNYGNPPAIMVSQYDENYDLVFEVFDGVVPATGLNAYTVKLVGRQPGEDPALKYEFTGTVSGTANNILSFTIDTTMTGKAGKGTAEIVILDTTNDVKFASFNLPVYVEKAAVPDDAIDADVEREQEIAEEIQEIVDNAAATVKGEAEAWAVGQRDGEDVPSTDPTYENNAKYYAEQAQDIADSIGIDATLSVAGKAADAKKTGDEISALKEDLNIVNSRSDTLLGALNYSFVKGSLKSADGSELTSNNALRTGFIDIGQLSKVHVLNPKEKTHKFFEYDSSKGFLRTNTAVSTTDYDYTFGANTAYIRFQIAETSIELTAAEGFILLAGGGYVIDYIAEKTPNNLSDKFFSRVGSTQNGVTYTWDGSTCTAVGTADGNSYNRVYYVNKSTMPAQLSAGKKYYISCVTTDPNLRLQMLSYKSDESYSVFEYNESCVLEIPADTVGLLFRLYVNNGVAVSATIKVDIYDVPRNEAVYRSIPERVFNNPDFNDLTDTGVYVTFSDLEAVNAPVSPVRVGVLETIRQPSYRTLTALVTQKFTQWDTGLEFRRRGVNDNWTDWTPNNGKNISILFVGNSLTQDGIAYLPYMLKTYYPEVNFRFYMWYNGGFTLAQHYGYFANDTPCGIFSVAENTESWTNYRDTKKMSSILTTYKFDVVCLQEYFNYKSSYSDTTDWKNCKDFIQSHYTGGNGLEFISLFHAPLRSNADSVFGLTKTGNALILQDTITQDMIPNGIAVYRALSTDLDDLGDAGHLSPDGTHTQEGLPCLLQTYVTLCWLFEKLSINKSVYGCPFRMTTEIYETLNVPGANLGSGVITGTDVQNLLAQEVAIKAYKEGKHFALNNLYSD